MLKKYKYPYDPTAITIYIFTFDAHGMSTKINMSNANEVGLLTCYALKNDFFAKIVRTKTYSCWIYGDNERPVRWENLNKLIDYGFHGVKTGITPNAGKI